MADHLEVTGYEIEQLGDVFAEFAQPAATVGTGAVRRRVYDGLARQVGGQGTWCTRAASHAMGWGNARGVFSGQLWLIGHFTGRAHQQLPQRQLQLHQCGVDALGRAAEAPALESGDLGDELGDHLVAPDQQALECCNIIRQCI
jgi:hypothetical protein